MPKLRIKVSGSMRTLTGAEHFAAIRSYIATATRQGIGVLDALIQAAGGNPWIPATASTRDNTGILTRLNQAPIQLQLTLAVASPFA